MKQKCYGLVVLDNVYMLQNRSIISPGIFFKKSFAIKNPKGKRLLGDEIIKQSLALKGKKLSPKNLEEHNQCLPFFNLEYNRSNFNKDFRILKYSDVNIEFDFNVPENSCIGKVSEKIENYSELILIALRLIDNIAIRGNGPVIYSLTDSKDFPDFISRKSKQPNYFDQNSIHHDKFYTLTANKIKQVKHIFSILKNTKNNKLEIPLKMLMLSHLNDEFENKVLNIATGLEALYLPENSPELNFRLALFVATHHGRKASDRKEIFDKIKIFYDLRSKIIHGSIHKIDQYRLGRAKSIKIILEIQDILRIGCYDSSIFKAKSPKLDFRQYIADLAIAGEKFKKKPN